MTTLIRWLSPTKKIQYHFSSERPSGSFKGYWVPFALFPDDTRIDTLTKVFYYLEEFYQQHHARTTEWRTEKAATRKDLPLVAWESSQGFLFQPDVSWSHWTPNPFKLNPKEASKDIETLVQTPTHVSLATTLTQATQFSFACRWDIPFLTEPLPWHWYSLYQDSRPLLSREAVFQQHRILTDLLQRSHLRDETHRRIGEGMDDYHETGTFEFVTRVGGTVPVPFKVLFDALSVSVTLPLVQWKEGAAQPVLYRLYKQHTIQEPTLTALLDVTKIPPTEKRFTVVYTTTHKNIPVYFKATFIQGKKPMYYMTVKLRNQVVETQWVQQEIQSFKKRLTQFSNDYTFRFNLETTHLRAHVTLPMTTPIEAKHLAAFGWLFKLQAPLAAPHRHSWVLTYLRSANMHQRLRSDEFIQSQLVFMEDEHELLQMIQRTFQVSDTKARELLKDYYVSGMSTGAAAAPVPVTKKKVSWVDIPATVTLMYQPTTQSYLVQCDRFLNSQDLERMWVWLQGMMATIEATPKAPSSPPPNVFQMPEEESPDVLLSSSDSRRSHSSSSASARSNASSLIGGTYDLNEKLKAADPELFIHTRLPNNTSRYPRLCSANTNQQPVVLTPDEMAAIDASPYKNSYDGKVLYGSDKDPKKHHYYMCPRIWCPVSKVPLTPEQYNELGGKCPAPHQEEPWLFYDADYWGRNPNTPHYIGFHKKQGTNQLCLPCCKRLDKPATEKEQILKKCSVHVRPTSEPPIPPPEKEKEQTKTKGRKSKPTEEDYYLLRFPAPISAKRWGILPESMHQMLKPKQPYAHCYTQLKSDQQCPVRKGIVHHKDSLLNALGSILTNGTGGKREWLAHLEKHFTPQDFLALQNGWVLSNFLDRDPIYPQKHLAMVLHWRDWIKAYPGYIQAMQLKPLVERAALVATMKRTDQWRLSRELAIYVAWRRFWDYLRSTEPKDIYFMYDLMLHLNIRLVVWEKHGDDVYLQCPMADDAGAEWFHSVYVERAPYAMVMYENGYYEPIELKSRGTKGILQIDDQEMVKRLNELTGTCMKQTPVSRTPLQSFQLCATVPALMSDIGGGALMPNQLVISPAMALVGMRLKCGVYVQWPHSVPMIHHKELMGLLHVKKLVYLEDLEGEGWLDSTLVPTEAVRVYLSVLKTLEFKWNVGSIAEAETSGMSVLRLRPITQWNQLERAVIPVGSMLPLDEIQWKMESEQAYWNRLQRDIGRKVLSHLEDIQSTFKTHGIPGVLALPYFHRLPDPSDIRTVLEGMPLSQDAATVHAWWNGIGTKEPYPIYTHRVKDGFSTHEWMFAQGAVAKGLPGAVRQPPKAPFVPTEKDTQSPMVDLIPYPHRVRKATAPPTPANDWRPLPNKWLQRKQYGWDAYQRAEYPLSTLLTWLANAYHTPLPLDILRQLHRQRVYSLLHDESQVNVWETYLQDPLVWRRLAKQMNVPANKSVTVLKKYLKLPKNTQWELWLATEVAATPATEMDVWVFSQLTQSVVLVLHRSPSGQGVETHERHGIQDFVASATVFAPPVSASVFLQCPLVLLFKEAKIDAQQATFEWVQYQQQPFFSRVQEAPKPLQQLIHAVSRS
jgi:hypothetical protein